LAALTAAFGRGWRGIDGAGGVLRGRERGVFLESSVAAGGGRALGASHQGEGREEPRSKNAQRRSAHRSEHEVAPNPRVGSKPPSDGNLQESCGAPVTSARSGGLGGPQDAAR
jgi:hypothetical protein